MIDPIKSIGAVKAVQLAGIDRVRERIAEIEERFGIGGDNSFQATLEREMKKAQKTGRAQAAQPSNRTHKSAEVGAVERAVDAIGASNIQRTTESADDLYDAELVSEFDDLEQSLANEAELKSTEPAGLVSNNPINNQTDNPINNQTNAPTVNQLPGEEALNPFVAPIGVENPTPTPDTIREPLVNPIEESAPVGNETEFVPSTTEEMLEFAAAKYNVDPNLVKAIATAESNWDQSAVSAVGAVGVMQLMPETAAGLGVNPYDERQNIEGGAKYIRQMLDTFGGNVRNAVAAYNAGPGAVQRYGGVPPYSETQSYVGRVLDLYE